MSFLMFTAGSTRGARLRSVSVRALLLCGGIAALGLLSIGAGLGYWTAAHLIAPVAAPVQAAQERARPALPFAIEQLGALSGRLFTLESLAGQLSTRLGTTPGAPARPAPAASSARPAGSGGPMLPPRPAQQALADLGSLQARLDEIEQQIARLSDVATQRSLALMRLPTRLPLAHAALVSAFGNRDDPLTGRRAFHAGLDFAAGHGTAILAAAGGMVALAGFRPDYGWVVEIEHGNGLRTRYAHAARLLVKAGDVVSPGEVIAAVGSTGRSTGPHLHFELLRNGEATDPRRYLAGL